MVPTIGLMMTDFLQQCVLLKRILFFQKANSAYVSIPESVSELCSELGLPFVDLLNSSDYSRMTQELLDRDGAARLSTLQSRKSPWFHYGFDERSSYADASHFPSYSIPHAE